MNRNRELESLGLVFQGYTTHPELNGGDPTPCYGSRTSRLATPAGWNEEARKQNRDSFKTVNGREPESDQEALAWARSYAAM